MPPNVFEINGDKINKINVVSEFYAIFSLVMLKNFFYNSIKFAGPVDPRCYWSYGASNILS